jgi:hypothetical protein
MTTFVLILDTSGPYFQLIGTVVIHSVLRAIGTRYVGKSSKNRKIDAALHNFNGLAKCCGQKQFFKKVAADID